MKSVKTVKEIRACIAKAREDRSRIGFVPTMGALHEGHYSLLRKCREECDYAVVSIFVNPTQFGPGEDLARYPRTLEADAAGCEKNGADLLFYPDALEMYPEGHQTFVTVERVSRGYCGEKRPGHFRGVATVVTQLFNMVAPDTAYFGEKDFQQSAVIRRMAKDLHIPVEIRVLPIVREPDGLAMSSRNAYLNPEERKAATVLFRAIETVRRQVRNGERNPEAAIQTAQEILESEPLAEPEYVAVARDEDLEPAWTLSGAEHLLLAARIGKTRLIDNTGFQDVIEEGTERK